MWSSPRLVDCDRAGGAGHADAAGVETEEDGGVLAGTQATEDDHEASLRSTRSRCSSSRLLEHLVAALPGGAGQHHGHEERREGDEQAAEERGGAASGSGPGALAGPVGVRHPRASGLAAAPGRGRWRPVGCGRAAPRHASRMRRSVSTALAPAVSSMRVATPRPPRSVGGARRRRWTASGFSAPAAWRRCSSAMARASRPRPRGDTRRIAARGSSSSRWERRRTSPGVATPSLTGRPLPDPRGDQGSGPPRPGRWRHRAGPPARPSRRCEAIEDPADLDGGQGAALLEPLHVEDRRAATP